MPRLFNIAIVQPLAGAWAHVFDDVARLLQASLRTLGHAAMIRYGQVDPSAQNISLGYHLLKEPEQLRDMIVYQFEPLGLPGTARYLPHRLELLRAAREIWEYSEVNLAFLQSQGITNAKLLPLGYHPDLETIPNLADEPIDVLFYGVPADRRVAPVEELNRRCKFRLLFGVYGPERDQVIAQSKIVLNMHCQDNQPFEQARVSYLLNNSRFVVSESSPDDPYPGATAMVPWEHLVVTCLDFLAKPREREGIARRGHELLKKMPMPELLAGVLD